MGCHAARLTSISRCLTGYRKVLMVSLCSFKVSLIRLVIATNALAFPW